MTHVPFGDTTPAIKRLVSLGGFRRLVKDIINKLGYLHPRSLPKAFKESLRQVENRSLYAKDPHEEWLCAKDLHSILFPIFSKLHKAQFYSGTWGRMKGELSSLMMWYQAVIFYKPSLLNTVRKEKEENREYL